MAQYRTVLNKVCCLVAVVKTDYNFDVNGLCLQLTCIINC